MKHPFSKLIFQALKKSTLEDNQVLKTVEAIRAKGYSEQEIYDVLKQCAKGHIDETNDKIMHEALEEFSRYI